MYTEEARCFLEFWNSFVSSMNKAGGISDPHAWKDKTLYELSLVLAQNGIRFTYDKNGVIDSKTPPLFVGVHKTLE